MPQLALSLLGPPLLERDGKSVEGIRRKAKALLAYLAIEEGVHSREALATLFWPSCGESRARGNLRRSLFDLSRALEKKAVVSEQDTLRLDLGQIRVDVGEFRRLARGCGKHDPEEPCTDCLPVLDRAATLYQKDFLSGFTLPDCRDFDQWMFLQGETLRSELSSVLRRLVRVLEALGSPLQAIGCAKRLLSLDSLEESVHRELIRLYGSSGQRAAAVRQYRECQRILQEELNQEPEEATTALYLEVARRRQLESLDRASHASTRGQPTPPVSRPADEMRLVTIVTVGISFSPDPEWDSHPEERSERVGGFLTTARELLASRGAYARSDSPDSLLGVFGWPKAREADAGNAVRSASQLLTEARRHGLQAAAGVDTGMIYVGPTADGEAPPRLAGPALGRSSRLHYRAADGTVLVGPATRRFTRGSFRYREVQLAPAGDRAYQLADILVRPEKFYGMEGMTAEIVGREEELRLLQGAVDRSIAGQGQVVVLVGEAGIGKTRLIRELQRWTEQKVGPGLQWLEGQCQEVGQTTAYGPFLDLLRSYFAIHPGADNVRHAARVTSGLRRLVDRGALDREALEEVAPLLGRMLALRFGNDWDRRLARVDPEQIRYRTLRALSGLLASLASLAPTIVVLEDLHWADDLSLDLVAMFLEVLPARRLLLLCGYRPEPEHRSSSLRAMAQRKGLNRYTECVLRGLSDVNTARLVQALLSGGSIPVRLAETVFARSQGNPFVVEEILRSMIDAGVLRRQGRQWHVDQEPGIELLPDGVLALVQSRLDRLENHERALLECAAVTGEYFSLGVVAKVTRTPAVADSTLRSLTRAGFVYEERSAPEREFAFVHELVRRSVYRGIPPRRRAQLHGEIAAAIEDICRGHLADRYERLAYHFERSDLSIKAAEYLLRAGEKARRGYLNEEARRCFQRVLELEATGPEGRRKQRQIKALTGLGKVHEMGGRIAEMERCFRQAVNLGRELRLENRRLAQLYCGLGIALHYQGRYQELAALAEEGLILLRQRPESTEAALMNLLLAYCYSTTKPKAYVDYTRRSARYLARLPYSEELVRVFVEIAWVEGNDGNTEATSRWLTILEGKAKANHDLKAAVISRSFSAMVFRYLRGRLPEAVQQYLENLELIEKIGFTNARCFTMAWVGWIYEFLGDLARAEEYGRKALEAAEQMDVVTTQADACRNIATALLGQGERSEGLRFLRRAEQIYNNHGDGLRSALREQPFPVFEPILRTPVHSAEAAINLIKVGRTYLAVGRRGHAESVIRRGLELLGGPTLDWQLTFIMALAGIEEATNDSEEFRAVCGELRERASRAKRAILRQWYLEPAAPRAYRRGLRRPEFQGALPPGWSWVDPTSDGVCSLGEGVELRAANGRDLWNSNTDSPRLVRKVEGDFAAATLCGPASADRPAMGGLLAWQDEDNFMHVERGYMGAHQLTFKGRIDGRNRTVGRGYLPDRETHLRLERREDRFRALCSADGNAWRTLGATRAPFHSNLNVGIFAIGWINRTFYLGEFPEGSAIRFASFDLWQ